MNNNKNLFFIRSKGQNGNLIQICRYIMYVFWCCGHLGWHVYNDTILMLCNYQICHDMEGIVWSILHRWYSLVVVKCEFAGLNVIRETRGRKIVRGLDMLQNICIYIYMDSYICNREWSRMWIGSVYQSISANVLWTNFW